MALDGYGPRWLGRPLPVEQFDPMTAPALPQEFLLARLIASAPVGIAILDLDMRFIAMNEPLASMNGLPMSAHLGNTVQEVVPNLYPLLAGRADRT